MKSKPKSKPAKTGPKPETLKLSGGWKRAVKQALSKPRPAGGWPK